MAGAYYIWILGAFFIGLVGVMALVGGIFLIGHWLEKKETGAKHGLFEVPEELRGNLTKEDTEKTEEEGKGEKLE